MRVGQRPSRRWFVTVVVALVTYAGAVAVATPAGARSTAKPPPGTGTGSGWCTTYGVAGTTAKFPFDNVYACSPTTTKGPTPFDENGTDSFQCVELSARYLWAIYNIWVPHPSDGWDLVDHVHTNYSDVPVGTPSPTTVPAAGDVMSFGPGGSVDPSVGHTAIVVATDPSTPGRFKVTSQNFPEGTAGQQWWRVDLAGNHNGKVRLDGSTVWTKAKWLHPTLHTTITPSSGHPADPICTNDGADQGTTNLLLKGSYYKAGDPLVIRTVHVLLGNVTVPPNGRWSFSFDVPKRPDGNYAVTVGDAGGLLASLSFYSGAYTCFQWSNSDWKWDAVGWDKYSPMTFYIDGVQMDYWSASANGAMPTRHFTYTCPSGLHGWQVTGTLGGGPGHANGLLTCS